MLREVAKALRDLYGDITVQITDPFEMVLLENAAYLVDDARRIATFRALKKAIGTSPDAILRRSVDEIAEVIAGGGMKPEHRAAKVHESATVAQRIGLPRLRDAVRNDPETAKKFLREFPSVGEPYADRILLIAGGHPRIAPDSNALRVLCRLGFVEEAKSYSTTYRKASLRAASEVKDATTARTLHLLLRRHGREVCKTSEPRCALCPLRKTCAWYQNAVA
jgi:endonuclease III